MRNASLGESSATVRARVQEARARLQALGPLDSLEALAARVSRDAHTLLELGVDRLKMSARAYLKALRIAHTIAALDDSSSVKPPHAAEALQYRVLDREPR
ncbi:MAG: hypothetical protein WBG86_10505 [Polyangiales bacterium]